VIFTFELARRLDPARGLGPPSFNSGGSWPESKEASARVLGILRKLHVRGEPNAGELARPEGGGEQTTGRQTGTGGSPPTLLAGCVTCRRCWRSAARTTRPAIFLMARVGGRGVVSAR
jgi:hypothetical protein